MLETLEHVEDPLRAMAGGCSGVAASRFAIISSCMDFPVHAYPADYWRFTPEGFDLLLKEFASRRVYVQGHPRFPHSLVGVGRKGSARRLFSPWTCRASHFWYTYARNLAAYRVPTLPSAGRRPPRGGRVEISRSHAPCRLSASGPSRKRRRNSTTASRNPTLDRQNRKQ